MPNWKEIYKCWREEISKNEKDMKLKAEMRRDYFLKKRCKEKSPGNK